MKVFVSVFMTYFIMSRGIALLIFLTILAMGHCTLDLFDYFSHVLTRY